MGFLFYFCPPNSNLLIKNIDLSNINGKITVKFSNEGLTINDTLYEASNYQAMGNVAALTSVQVGSTEGSGRSNAANYSIKVRQK